MNDVLPATLTLPTYTVHACRKKDVDEKPEERTLVYERTGVRTGFLSTPEFLRFVHINYGPAKRKGKLNDAFVMLTYGIKHPTRGRKRILMDLDKMIEKWTEAIVGMAHAHDKAAADRYEATTDDLMAPLLTAPVKQLRELYAKLLERLKNDERVPYVIWRALETWGKTMIVDAPDEGVIKLKKKLAKEIVALCEEEAVPQIPEAMVRALQWRSEEQLEEMKATMEKQIDTTGKTGAKVRGRESCLFLEAGKGKNKAIVQL